MAALWNRAGHYIFVLCFFFPSSSFFLAYSQPSHIRCLPYIHTRCGLNANLGCRSETCCVRLAENTRRKKAPKNSPSVHHRTILFGYIFATKTHINNWKKNLVKQQYLPHMSSQYGELRPTSGWDRFTSLRHSCKFQRVWRLGFVTAAMSLNGSQPNFARCIAVSWAGIHYIYIFGGSCLVTEFCQVQNSLRVLQVLRSPILAALLQGTLVVGVSQLCAVEQRAPPMFGRAAIMLGIGPHSSLAFIFSPEVCECTDLIHTTVFILQYVSDYQSL